MPTVSRVTANWSGFIGAPGYSRFAFQDLTNDTAVNAATAAVRAFLNGLAATMPTGVKIDVSPVVDHFDMATGELTGSDVGSVTPSQIVATGSATSWAGGSGYAVTWKTGIFFRGRRVVGRTFIVPAATICFDTDGTLTSSIMTTITNATTNLTGASGAEFCVWSRVFDPAPPHHQVDGALSVVSAGLVKDSAAQLRTRRT